MIEIENLTIAFTKGKPVVDYLNLSVPDGKRTIVIGESGSGKSMMLSAILQVLPPDAAVSGSIRLDGLELLNLTEKEMKKIRGARLAYIPQGSANSLNPVLTVGFQVAEPIMEVRKKKREEAIRMAVDWMRRLQLGNEERLASAYPHMLSGGMRQRVLIAMGAAAGAEVLLADEPTKGLDKERIERVQDMLLRLEGKTLLCISHDLRFSREIADYISVMYAAEQVEYCTKEEFFRNPLHPYSQMLLAALPENGMKVTAGFAPPHGKDQVGGCRFAARCPGCTEQCRRTAPPMITVGKRKVRCHRYADSG
ncbi:MAG: ABC transporter ATP-binding protein [Eubacteriales bacterium]|nr:ABC transporter ATP-binding protein [Eubacteriales bacterium]